MFAYTIFFIILACLAGYFFVYRDTEELFENQLEQLLQSIERNYTAGIRHQDQLTKVCEFCEFYRKRGEVYRITRIMARMRRAGVLIKRDGRRGRYYYEFVK